MIVINKKLSKEVIANGIASGRVSEKAPPKAFLVHASVYLHRLFDMQESHEQILPSFSNREFAAAEVIHWLIGYLEKLNCPDIEKLLRDVADYRKLHPDYPHGQWPWR